jgi:hypothetical protein
MGKKGESVGEKEESRLRNHQTVLGKEESRVKREKRDCENICVYGTKET